MSEIEIRPMRYGSAVVQRLVEAIYADQTVRYGGPDQTRIESFEFDPPDGGFLVAYLDGTPVGCVGWRSHGDDETTAEVKRLFAAPEARNTGVATTLMRAIEQNAKDHGRTRMILETGHAQPEAMALYEKLGYVPIPHFGHYKDTEGVRSYGRPL
ncbi:GNAT superfamily N-acetyltransferase [Allocatelliglobosispora scoriae]|uniref:GNAT superfamily N-acetyltransferase n=1 Tax=Allocatelliglobosispora scoriae TaxID=643052 RepID=A0A841BXE1_9ACTN|nr:GNAT family N-acetyltransferase [Allocatelliglobosispora scoriae]MBB5872186.1 GNAT superfamily N-acetyltransferase [Allocatelliglobosispora scoriae]